MNQHMNQMKNIPVYPVPAADIQRYLDNLRSLMEIHLALVSLIRKEDELKAHHRAYLHIRDKINETIEQTEPVVADIAAQMMESFEDFDEAGAGEDYTEDEDDCPCYACGLCECAGMERCCDFSEETVKKYEPEKEKKTEPDEKEVPDRDAPMICMSAKHFGVLIDDLLTLAELLDKVAEMRRTDYDLIHEYGRFIPAFAAFEHDRLDVYDDARAEADRIAEKWDNAKVESTEYVTVGL